MPQVAVVGSQRSGKSSVLEALVGRDFLPRCCDICTRRPLVLMLENQPESGGDGGKKWGEVRHFRGKRFYDFSEIRQEIQDIIKNCSIAEALSHEEKFFHNHPVLPYILKKLFWF